MTVPSRILVALAFALFLLRGVAACESTQPALIGPADCYHAAQTALPERAAHAAAGGEHCRSASCHVGCCVGCGAHCGLFPPTFAFDAGRPRGVAPAVLTELHRAGIVRAPLLPPPIA